MIHLQGLGPCSAKPASEFKIGDDSPYLNRGLGCDVLAAGVHFVFNSN